jgi:hypothetical protein
MDGGGGHANMVGRDRAGVGGQPAGPRGSDDRAGHRGAGRWARGARLVGSAGFRSPPARGVWPARVPRGRPGVARGARGGDHRGLADDSRAARGGSAGRGPAARTPRAKAWSRRARLRSRARTARRAPARLRRGTGPGARLAAGGARGVRGPGPIVRAGTRPESESSAERSRPAGGRAGSANGGGTAGAGRPGGLGRGGDGRQARAASPRQAVAGVDPHAGW